MTNVAETLDAKKDADRLEIGVENALLAFERAARVLQRSCDKLEKEGAGEEKEVMRDVRNLNAALLHTLGMQEKAREAGIDRFGKGGQGKLDLGQARSEIGLRLACLRERGEGS